MRPTYETSRDRRVERAIAARLAHRHGFTFEQQPKFSPLDLRCYDRSGVMFWLEVKRRGFAFGKYKDIILSEKKWQAAEGVVQQGLSCLLAFQFTTGVRCLSVSLAMQPELREAGRRDRGDAQDVEPCRVLLNEWWTPWDAPRLPRNAPVSSLMVKRPPPPQIVVPAAAPAQERELEWI